MKRFGINFAALALVFGLVSQAIAQPSPSPLRAFSDGSDGAKDISDEINDGRPITLTPEIINQISAQLGMAPDSPGMRRLIDSYYRSREQNENPIENIDDDEDPDSATPAVVIRHFRGTNGIPLPAKEDIPFPFKVTQEAVKEAFIEYFKVVTEAQIKNITPATLPACRVNESTQEETGYTGEEMPDQLIADILFMDKTDMPMDPSEAFGKRTMVRPYNSKEANFEVLGAIGIGVDCLPFRWRVTRKFLFKDKGRNALKNYDANQFGEGEFSEVMKAKLGLTQ